MKTGDRYIFWGDQGNGHFSHEFTLSELQNSLRKNGFKIIKILGAFNLINKYEQDKIRNKERFVKMQIKYAEEQEYINNSSDFFFISKKLAEPSCPAKLNHLSL